MSPDVSIRNLEREFNRKALQIYTDAKSLEATVTKDAGLPSDKRVRILVAQIKELLRGPNEPEAGGCSIYWLDTSQMLADVLTKQGCEQELMLEVLSTGRWTLLPTEMACNERLRFEWIVKPERLRSNWKLRTGENLPMYMHVPAYHIAPTASHLYCPKAPF